MTDDELKRLLDAHAAETRRHFDVTTEGLRHAIELVAESVTGTREMLVRETTDIRDEMRRGFAETQAMIKFSHAELDRRVRALEEGQRTVEQTLADMQARLERLEGSTH
ncbi:MAG TPA: hypothetical protein VGF69_03240 [Thermoanaerobaculia bacterium]|jgi:hypothetical protein